MTDQAPDAARLAADLSRKSTEFEILQRVSTAINASLDLDEIYDVALRTMDELFAFHHAIILLLEPDSETLRVVASRGYEGQAMGGKVRLGTGVIGVVAQRRKLLHVANLGQTRAYVASQRREMMKAGRGEEIADQVPVPGLANAESQIAIPLVVGDRLIGVFSIESPVRRSFSEHDEVLVTIVANQIASAIQNARLYEERRQAAAALQRVNESLEERVRERTAALERELGVAQELLSEARARIEGPLLGDSAAVRALRSAIADQAQRGDSLLLVGPPGAGKEMVARAIHDDSGRKGAFIQLNCAQLATGDRGAWFGSRSDAGLVPEGSKLALARGGTLYLDAVHELPMDLQTALCELLQQEATDAAAPSAPAAIRIIASTTRDLGREVESGRMNHRLFRALGRNQLAVPALVERREDIADLAQHFALGQARQLGKTIEGIGTASLERLAAYSWPGNIRELRGVVERAVLLARHPVVEIEEEALGQQLAAGSYRLIEPIGAGGMGEVWLGKHQLLARPAAIKLIRADTGPDRDRMVRRFHREAQVTSALRSPHTVQLYDFGLNDSGSFYYVMELLQGLDLQQIVTRFGPQKPARVVFLLRQACWSLAEAHAQGLVHRDIKPANLFVTRLGPEHDFLKVLDFGMVKGDRDHDATMLSSQGVVQGTPAFMAPELVTGESEPDGRTDLYSLACSAYQILSGRTVFEAASSTQMLLHHVREAPRPLQSVASQPIPAELDALIARCLAKHPAERPESALALDRELGVLHIEPWTQEQARAWWAQHAPEAIT